MQQLSEILCQESVNTDKLILKPCMCHQRVGQPHIEWLEPADTIIIRKTLNNEVTVVHDHPPNKVNLICTLWCSFLSCFRGWKSLACNEYSLGLKYFFGWRRHQTIVDTESHSSTLFLSEFSTNVMCFQLSFDNEHHELNEVLRKSSYNTASYQEL